MTKERILEVTEELMKSQGLQGLTTRKIADHAGTNVASVNYHFGSKERLINEILRKRLDSFRVAFDELDNMKLPPVDRLKRFLLSYATQLMAYPELAQYFLTQEQLFDSHLQYLDFIRNQGINKLIGTLTDIIGPSEEDKVMPILTQMFAAVFFPMVLRSNAKFAMATSIFRVEQTMEEQIDLFVGSYFYRYMGRSVEEA